VSCDLVRVDAVSLERLHVFFVMEIAELDKHAGIFFVAI
jgi:hypothetical protein